MISAKDELTHLAECLSEEEAGKVLGLLTSVAPLLHSIESIRKNLPEDDPKYTALSSYHLEFMENLLKPCSQLYYEY